MDIDIVLKAFDDPDEVKVFPKGRFEVVHVGGMTIGRATYEPGWKWSEDVGKALGQRYCNVGHTGMVLAGTATAAFENGEVFELTAGQVFYIPEVPHDSWVVGDVPYTSLHFTHAQAYLRQ